MKDNYYESHLLPNGTQVAFFPETHTYLVEGKEVPSITTVLSMAFGDSYAKVNPDFLKRAADYGTAVHQELQELIELDQMGIPISPDHQETENYFRFIKPLYEIDPILMEKVVALYDKENVPIAAGRFDLLCKVKGELTLCDFKTTSTIKKQLVTSQLNLYRVAARQSGYLDTADIKLGVIHLTGETSRFVPVPKLNDDFYFKIFEKIG